MNTLVALTLACLVICGCHAAESKHDGHDSEHETQNKILVTTPIEKDVISTQQYVCQIHSRRHIEVRALEGGYLEEIHVKEGQSVKQGTLMFKIVPVLYKAKLDKELAERQVAQIEYNNATKLFQQNVISEQELALVKAKLAKADAQVGLAQAEFDFTNITAPFDGIVGKQSEQQGSLVEEGDILSTFSDNEVMWVYFNVPEARYLEYMQDPHKNDVKIELMLADHTKFGSPGQIGAIEADFNNTTGNIAFRADFANPGRLLRHGQTGTILLHRKIPKALVIPQRATYEILAKRYVFVVGSKKDDDDDNEHAGDKIATHAAVPRHDEDGDDDGDEDGDDDLEGVVHQRDITVRYEMDDIFVIESGLSAHDKIVLEGIRQVRDGEEIDYRYVKPEEALKNLKFHAE